MRTEFDPKYDLDIKGLDRAEVLKALYDAARPVGMGFLQYTPEPMPIQLARDFIGERDVAFFDYIGGRPLKVSLTKDGVLQRFDLYDRDQGAGKAAAIVGALRAMKR